MKKILMSLMVAIMSLSAFATQTGFVRITLNGENGDTDYASTVVLVKDDARSATYEQGYDAECLSTTPSGVYGVMFYGFVGTKKCEYIYTNDFEGIEFGFVTNVLETSYTLSFSDFSGDEFILYDRVTNTPITVNASTPDYDFTATAGQTTVNDRFVIGLPTPTITITGTGSWYGQGKDVTLTTTDDVTATGTLTFDDSDLAVNYGYYNFKVVRGTEWLSDGAEFTNASPRAITTTATDDMWFLINPVGEYTFTWTYATNTLEITFPAAPATGYTVTPNANGWATFSAAEATVIPTGATVYRGVIEGEELQLHAIADYVPANTGVIVSGSGALEFEIATVTVPELSVANDLKATSTYSTSLENVYVLKGENFLKYVGTDLLAANKAYIQLGSGSGAPQRIRMVVNHATGVENVEAEVKAEKFVENGQIFIRRGNEVYNLQGQKIVK